MKRFLEVFVHACLNLVLSQNDLVWRLVIPHNPIKFFYFNKKYEIVVTIKTIITQIERLARSCFSLEFDCKKLGSTNINTPIM